MSNTPFVSIVMSTYNGSEFLDGQITSILQQDYSNIELIISDDCSTDDTWQKLNEWQKKTPLLKIHQNSTNLGYNKNFEKAIGFASGDFIALSDQDDIWLPQKISKLLNAFSDIRVILCHSRSVQLKDEVLHFSRAKLHHHFSGNDTRKFFLFNPIMGHDMMFRKRLVAKILPFPQGMSYDWWIGATATCFGTIASVPDFLTHHRIHASNSFFSTSSASKKKEFDLPDTLKTVRSIKALNDEHRAFLDEFFRLLADDQKDKDAFNFPLFKFFYKNRKVFFGHKNRVFPALSYLKNAVKYATINFNNKGMSI